MNDLVFCDRMSDTILHLPVTYFHMQNFSSGKKITTEVWRETSDRSPLRSLYKDILYTIGSSSNKQVELGGSWPCGLVTDFACSWVNGVVPFKIPASKEERQKIRCRYHLHDAGEKCE